MAASAIASPKQGAQLVDEYFIENRTRLLEVAAYLDRLDRAGLGDDDFRMRAFREALGVLATGGYSRVQRIQLLFSDPTTQPREALDTKSARGAYDADREAGR